MNRMSKKSYSAPKLANFGSVRNLTGGSASFNMDGNTMMVMNATMMNMM